MKAKELKEWINQINDDYEIEFVIESVERAITAPDVYTSITLTSIDFGIFDNPTMIFKFNDESNIWRIKDEDFGEIRDFIIEVEEKKRRIRRTKT
jgi:hypothetical protein